MEKKDSHIEISGFTAKHYDFLMNLITFGTYPTFIRRVIRDMGLKEGDKVLDLGAGTGRNAVLMREYVGNSGLIVGVEIGEEMKRQFKKKTEKYKNILLVPMRIETPLPFYEEFDKVFMSFVLHGFTQDDRRKIIENAWKALKPGGKFQILDYSEFDFNKAPFYVRIAFKKIECPLAFDFISRDWKKILSEKGFGNFREVFYMKGYVRLLEGTKV